MNTAKLIEPGVRYFLDNSLKNCYKKKIYYNNNLFNLSLFFLFSLCLAIFLYYKFRTKPTIKDLYKREQEKKYYILSQIKKLNLNKAKMHQQMITNLPQHESHYELMHKNF